MILIVAYKTNNGTGSINNLSNKYAALTLSYLQDL